MLIIIMAFSMISNNSLFPAPMSIFPLICVCIIIIKNNRSSILLSNILIKLGNISYSFYLFHYLIIYYHSKHVNTNAYNLIRILLITILLSTISYNYYENPIRKYLNCSTSYFLYAISLSSLLYLCRFYSKKNRNILSPYFKNEKA